MLISLHCDVAALVSKDNGIYGFGFRLGYREQQIYRLCVIGIQQAKGNRSILAFFFAVRAARHKPPTSSVHGVILALTSQVQLPRYINKECVRTGLPNSTPSTPFFFVCSLIFTTWF